MRSARALFAGVVAVGVAAVALLLRRQRVVAVSDAPSFESRFSVRASLEAVARFHSDPSALRRLTPAPMQVHRLPPRLGEHTDEVLQDLAARLRIEATE